MHILCAVVVSQKKGVLFPVPGLGATGLKHIHQVPPGRPAPHKDKSFRTGQAIHVLVLLLTHSFCDLGFVLFPFIHLFIHSFAKGTFYVFLNRIIHMVSSCLYMCMYIYILFFRPSANVSSIRPLVVQIVFLMLNESCFFWNRAGYFA